MKKSVKERRMLALAVEFEASEMNMVEFSQHHSIKPSSFRYWVAKNRRLKKSNFDFLPIETTTPAISTSSEVLVHYPNGVELRLNQKFSISEIKELIKY